VARLCRVIFGSRVIDELIPRRGDKNAADVLEWPSVIQRLSSQGDVAIKEEKKEGKRSLKPPAGEDVANGDGDSRIDAMKFLARGKKKKKKKREEKKGKRQISLLRQTDWVESPRKGRQVLLR